MQTYFDTYYENTTAFAFDNEDFKNVVCNAKDKITDEEFTNNKLWKDVTKVGSRAKTTFTYHDIDMYICVAKERLDLLRDLNIAQEYLDSKEPYYINDLSKEYFDYCASTMINNFPNKNYSFIILFKC